MLPPPQPVPSVIGSQVWQTGQARAQVHQPQSMRLPQMFLTIPHWLAHVLARDSGVHPALLVWAWSGFVGLGLRVAALLWGRRPADPC